MRTMTSQYEISGKNQICLVKRFSSRAEHNLAAREKIHWNKQHFGSKSPALPGDPFLYLNVVFSSRFCSCIYLRSKISLLIWLFVMIVKLARWSANLSQSDSYFSFGIICGRLWGSLTVEDYLRSILGIICGVGIICGTVQYWRVHIISTLMENSRWPGPHTFPRENRENFTDPPMSIKPECP